MSSVIKTGSTVNTDPVVIGTGTTASTGAGSIVIGKNNAAGAATSDVIIGNGISVGSGINNIAIGNGCATGSTASDTIVIGRASGNGLTGSGSVIVAPSSDVRAANVVVIGSGLGYGARGIHIGGGSNSSAATDVITIGNGSSGNSNNDISIGASATVAGVSGIALGQTATVGASSAYSIAIGYITSVTGGITNSTVIGPNGSVTRHGQFSHSVASISAAGDCQSSRQILRVVTTDATPTALTGAGVANAYLTLGTQRVLSGRISIAAVRTDVTGTAAAWPHIQFAAARDTSGNVRLLGAVTGAGTTTFSDGGAATWNVSVTADTVNQAVAITVTGEAAKTIRWVATADFTEVG